jgi:hypothetical protein
MVAGVLFGMGFAAVAVGASLLLGRVRGRAALALLLAAAAAVYVGATLGEQPGSAAVATGAFVVFGALALRGLEDARVLAWGWLAHAVWDLLHVIGLLDSGAPAWYEIGCLVADPLIAGYLFSRATRSQRETWTAEEAGEGRGV